MDVSPLLFYYNLFFNGLPLLFLLGSYVILTNLPLSVVNLLEFLAVAYPLIIFISAILAYFFGYTFIVMSRVFSFIGSYKPLKDKRSRYFNDLKIIFCYFLLTIPIGLTIMSLIQISYDQSKIIQ